MNKMPEIEERKRDIIEVLKRYFSDWRNVVFVLVLLLSLVLRFNYYNVNVAQWWDEADYTTGAKVIANSELRESLSQYTFNPRRPFFTSLFWGGILFFGGNDTALHFSVLLFSIIGVWLTYLIGKELFNKEAGIIGSLILGISWVHLFYTARFLTEIVATTFYLAAAYFFIKGFVKDDNWKMCALAGLFFGLSWFTRSQMIMMIVPFVVYLFLKDKFRLFLNKKVYITLLLILIAMSPFFLYLLSFENPIKTYSGVGTGRFEGGGLKGFIENTAIILNSFQGLFFTLLLIGLVAYGIDIVLGYDFIWKGDKEILKKIFVLLWVLMPWLFFGLTFNRGLEDRYFIPSFPIAFLIIGFLLIKAKELFEKYVNFKYSKFVAYAIILLILTYGANTQLKTADDLIKARANTFDLTKYAGEWIKERSDSKDSVVSASKYQNMYYSERDTFPFCEDNKCRENETIFIDKLKVINPKYVVVSVYEPGFTPQWAYTIGQRYSNLLGPVKAYCQEPGCEKGGAPLLIVYEYTKQNQTISG